MCGGEGACEKDQGREGEERTNVCDAENVSWMRGSEGGEGGRTNSCSGKSIYKKDVRERRGGGNKHLWWRGWTHEGEGRMGANVCGGKSACENNQGEEGRT